MSAPNLSVAMAQAVVDELSRSGVTRIVVAPGSRSAALAMAAATHPAIDLTVHIDERSAAFFALGIGRTGQGPAAVVTTSGTAVANLFPAIVEADAADVPLIVLSADRPPELRHTGANQTIDQIGIFGRLPRWFCEVGVPEHRADSNAYWRSTVCRAVAESAGLRGRRGPVHLNLAFREPLVPSTDDGRAVGVPFDHPLEGRPGGGAWTEMMRDETGVPVMALPEELAVERGLVVVGASPWARSASILAENLGWPLVAEAVSGVREPGSISTAHHLLSHPAWRETHRPDVVLRYGSAPLSPHLARFLASVDVSVVVDPAGWHDPGRSASRILAALPVSPGERSTGAWETSWQSAEAVVRAALDARLDSEERLTEPRIARDTALSVPEGGRLVVGSSMPVRDLDWFMPPRRIDVYGNRGASGIDGFVSTSLGVAVAAGASVALGGDLSLLHDANGFLGDSQADCVFVVVNNDGGGIFSFLPQADYPDSFERVFGTPHGRHLASLAQFHHISHHGIDRADELSPAIRAALVVGGIHLLEARTDRWENPAIHRRLVAAAHEALDELA